MPTADATQEPGLDAAGLEAAAVAGWNACRKSIYAVCEDVQNEADRLQTSSKPGTASEEQHAKGYYAGSRYAAKSIARGLASMEAQDDDNFRAAIAAYEAHRSGAGEPVAWMRVETAILPGVVGRRDITFDAGLAEIWRNNVYTESVAPLYAFPAKAGELEELRAELAYLPSRSAWDESRKALASMRNDLGASEARARRMEEALRPLAKAAQTGDEGTEPDDKSGKGFCHRMGDDYVIWRPSPTVSPIRMGDLRKARAALSDSPASAARPAVTGEMVEALMTALFGKYDERTNYHAWITPSWPTAEQKVRAALEAALSHAPASMNGTQGEAE